MDRTFAAPAENLACDEALLELGEEGFPHPILRFWEARQPFVVLGYSSPARKDVDLESCRRAGVPVLRRPSGGGTVLQGPGCVNYALVLGLGSAPELATVTRTNAWVMERHRRALEQALGRPVAVRGHTDLALGDRKFSGNAQRRRRRALLFHGSFLAGLDLGLMERVLAHPAREPDWRRKRAHRDFVANLDLEPGALKRALAEAWGAAEPFDEPLDGRISALAHSRYSDPAWTFRF